jgi:hypothetical protein
MIFVSERIKSAIDAVSLVTGTDGIEGPYMPRTASYARWLVWRLLRERGWSESEIGRRFKVTPSAVHTAMQKIDTVFTPEQIDTALRAFTGRRPEREYYLTHNLIAKGRSDNLRPVTHERVKADLRRVGMVAA